MIIKINFRLLLIFIFALMTALGIVLPFTGILNYYVWDYCGFDVCMSVFSTGIIGLIIIWRG